MSWQEDILSEAVSHMKRRVRQRGIPAFPASRRSFRQCEPMPTRGVSTKSSSPPTTCGLQPSACSECGRRVAACSSQLLFTSSNAGCHRHTKLRTAVHGRKLSMGVM